MMLMFNLVFIDPFNGKLAERIALASEAVALMARVPLSVDLGQVVPQLAVLKAFDKALDLALKVSLAHVHGRREGGGALLAGRPPSVASYSLCAS